MNSERGTLPFEPPKDFLPQESAQEPENAGDVVIARESFQKRKIQDHFSSFDESIVNPRVSYGEKEKIGVQTLQEFLEKAFGSEFVEALAERDSRLDIQTAQGKTIDAHALVSLLEQRGIPVDGNFLKKLLRDQYLYIQRLAFRLVGGVLKDDLLAFLSTLDKQYDEVWYNSSDRPDAATHFQYDIPEAYEIFDRMQKEVFSSIGDAIQRKNFSEEERAHAEGIFLSLIKKYIRDHFYGQDKGMPLGNIDQFIEKFVPEEDRQWYRRSYMGNDYRVNVLQSAFVSLGKIGGVESIRFIKEWVQFYPEALTKEVIDALSSIGGGKAAKEFLPLLKDKDPAIVRAATRVLHRLEFGHIGISKDGVRYLGKMYDCGEKNSPDHFAQRLTASGEIGIFDKNRRLINYFELEGLDSNEARIKATVLDFTYETLFTPRSDETSEERQQRKLALKEFQENYFGFYNDSFFKETGVRFNNLSFQEQGQLLLFYKSANDEEKKRALAFVKEYKEDGFRAFLSLEYGREMGNTILTIGERFPSEAAQQVFEKYSEIVGATEDVRSYVQEQFGEQLAQDPLAIDHIVENLLHRGKDLLVRFADDTHKIEAEDVRQKTQKALYQLANIKADILLFASAFREAAKSPKGAVLQDVRDMAMESVPASVLREEDRNEMQRVFRENRERTYPARLLKDSIEDFDVALTSDHAVFHILRYKGDYIGFLRFEQRPGGRMYLGSLNVRSETHGSSLGTALMHATIEQYDNRAIDAVVWDKNVASKSLLEKIGFHITGTIEDYHGTGEKFFMMERPAVITKEQKQESEELAAVV